MPTSEEWRERLSVPFSHRANCSYCGMTLVRRGETGNWMHLSTPGDYPNIHAAQAMPESVRPANPPTATFREQLIPSEGRTPEEWQEHLQEQSPYQRRAQAIQRRNWEQLHGPLEQQPLSERARRRERPGGWDIDYDPDPDLPDAMRWSPEQGEHEMSLWQQMFHDRREEGRRDRPT